MLFMVLSCIRVKTEYLLPFTVKSESNLTEVINAQNHRGETALWLTSSFASSGNLYHLEMVEAAAILLNTGADPNIPSKDSLTNDAITPLEMALQNNNVVISRLLLLAGARPSLLKESVKGRAWLGSISVNLQSKGLLKTQNDIDFVALAGDQRKLKDMTFSDVAFKDHCQT